MPSGLEIVSTNSFLDNEERKSTTQVSHVSDYEAYRDNTPFHSRQDQPGHRTTHCGELVITQHKTSISDPHPDATATAASLSTLFGLSALGGILFFFNLLSSVAICNPEVTGLHYLKMLTIPAILATLFLSIELFRCLKGCLVYADEEKTIKRNQYTVSSTGKPLKPTQKLSAIVSSSYQLATAVLPWGNLVAAACMHFEMMFGVEPEFSTLFYSSVGAFTLLVFTAGLIHKWRHSAWDMFERESGNTMFHQPPSVASLFSPAGLIFAFFTQLIQLAFNYIPTHGSAFAEQCVWLLRAVSVVLSAILVPELSAVIYGINRCGMRKPQTCKHVLSIIGHLAEKLKAPLALQGLFHLMQAISLHAGWGQAPGWQLLLDGNTSAIEFSEANVNQSCVEWQIANQTTPVNANHTSVAGTTAMAILNGTTAPGLNAEQAIGLTTYAAAAVLLILGCYAQHSLRIGYGKMQPKIKGAAPHCSCLKTKTKSRATTVANGGDTYQKIGPDQMDL